MPSIGERVAARLTELSRVSESEECLTRRFLTPAHRAAAELVQSWMSEAGMHTHTDAIGSVIGRLRAGSEPSPALLLGSHIDTVPNGGAFDGALGVVAAIECVRELHAQDTRLPFDVEVIAFGDEEGSRFPSTMTGSRALAGTLPLSDLAQRDGAGISLEAALQASGLDPAGIPGLARSPQDVLAYVELHIEQGPVLEKKAIPVGVVTSICGAVHMRVSVRGQAGHAGTVPMRERQDALTGAAEMILEVESTCARIEESVGTVGQLSVRPGAVNVIPGKVEFTIDIRAPGNDRRDEAVRQVLTAVETIAGERGLRVEITRDHEMPAAACATGIMDQLGAAVAAQGLPVVKLPSGAGHDAMVMASITDVGMLFVRCRGGVSHRPDEHASVEDIDVACRVLTGFVRDFDSGQAGQPSRSRSRR